MMASPVKILFDVNIWLDLYYPDRRGHACANELLDVIFSKGAELYYAASSLTDVFFLVNSIQKRLISEEGIELTDVLAAAANEVAWGCIQNMYEIAAPIPTSIPALFMATKMKSIHADFEDDVIVASAQTVGMDFLVSNDRQLLTKSTVPALSSEDMLAYLRDV